MELIIEPSGLGRCVYNETLDLTTLGPLSIRRASHVEPDDQGRWIADLSPVQGPALGPFEQRSEALAAEVAWLHAHWLDSALVQKKNHLDCSRWRGLTRGADLVDLPST